MPSLDRMIFNLQEYLRRECPAAEFEFSTGDEGGLAWFRSPEYLQISQVFRREGAVAGMVMLARISRKRVAETRLQVGHVDSVEFFGRYYPDRKRAEAARVFTEARLKAVAEGKLKLQRQTA
jgi:hypothetical protein